MVEDFGGRFRLEEVDEGIVREIVSECEDVAVSGFAGRVDWATQIGVKEFARSGGTVGCFTGRSAGASFGDGAIMAVEVGRTGNGWESGAEFL